MTKKEIIRDLAVQYGLDQTLTRKVVQGFLDKTIGILSESGRLELRNFGVFEIKQRAARKARNPKTNERILVPSKRVITFQAGKNVNRSLQGGSDSGPAIPGN